MLKEHQVVSVCSWPNSVVPSFFTAPQAATVNVIKQHLWMRWVGNSQCASKSAKKPVAWLPSTYGSVEEMFKQLAGA